MSEDMRKLINIVESYRNVLNEARIEDNPDVKYELAGATKAKTAAEEFSKITAFISGKTSELFTKLAKKFSEIDRLTKRIQQLRDEVNQEAKDQIDALFNAEDEVYTRYIETVSLSITMSKAIEEQRTQTSNLNVDAFITSDLKYHNFYEADNKAILLDIGHYESEQFTKTLLVAYLIKKIPNFAIVLSNTNTNPVKYL